MIENLNNFAQQYPYLGVLFLVFFENLFPPIPSELVLASAGLMVVKYNLNFIYMVLFATAGSYIGAIMLYFIGSILGQKQFIYINNKYFKYLRIKENDINKSYEKFHKSGKQIVFFARVVPVIRSLISLPAGSSKMNFTIFSALTILGSLLWNIIIIALGALFYNNVENIVKYIKIYGIIALLLIFSYILYKIIKVKKIS